MPSSTISQAAKVGLALAAFPLTQVFAQEEQPPADFLPQPSAEPTAPIIKAPEDGPAYRIDNSDNIRESAAGLAYDLMLFYNGNQTGMVPGILPGPPTEHKGDYYWWEGGAMMGTYIDYWHLTGDASYNEVVTEGILHQTGEDGNMMPRNHTASMGNDDQGFWGMTAMLAAENKFPNPPEDEYQWLALAQAVWNDMAHPSRHDDVCGGGLRWQVPYWNPGYDYKNTIANGCFFNIGSRLARYLDNETYAEWAEDTWDWLWSLEYIDHESWKVYDGGHDYTNCSDVNTQQFSYNAAILSQGAAFLYNYTESETWKDRLDNLLDSLLDVYFSNGAAYEYNCEGRIGQCSTDMLSFKGYVHRWLAVITQIAPHTAETLRPVLRESAEAAIAQCTGGESRHKCGFYWTSGEFVDPSRDGTSGAGEAMNVLAAVSSLLIDEADPPATQERGGISKGDPNAGNGGGHNGEYPPEPITTGDRAGAGILTAVLLGMIIGLFVWMSLGDGISTALPKETAA